MSLLASNTTALPAAPVPAVAPSITDNSPSVTVDSPIITFVASIVVDVNLFIPVTSFEASRTTALEAEAVPSVTLSNLLRSVVDEVKPVNLLSYYLMMPYLLWCSYALFLNINLVILN